MVTICTTSLTFNNSTFCPHTVFMCFVWISEQTAIISLYNINWLVFITQTQCVYCAVRTGSVNTLNGILIRLKISNNMLTHSISPHCNTFSPKPSHNYAINCPVQTSVVLLSNALITCRTLPKHRIVSLCSSVFPSVWLPQFNCRNTCPFHLKTATVGHSCTAEWSTCGWLNGVKCDRHHQHSH